MGDKGPTQSLGIPGGYGPQQNGNWLQGLFSTWGGVPGGTGQQNPNDPWQQFAAYMGMGQAPASGQPPAWWNQFMPNGGNQQQPVNPWEVPNGMPPPNEWPYGGDLAPYGYTPHPNAFVPVNQRGFNSQPQQRGDRINAPRPLDTRTPEQLQAAIAAQQAQAYAQGTPAARAAVARHAANLPDPNAFHAFLTKDQLSQINENLYPGMTAAQIHAALPANLQSTATQAEKNAAMEAWRAAEMAYNQSQTVRGSPDRVRGDPALLKTLTEARQAAEVAMYGPLGSNFAQAPDPARAFDGTNVMLFKNPDGTPLYYKPAMPRPYVPPPTRWGENFRPAQNYGYTDRVGVQQTLRAAGWNPVTGTMPVGRNPTTQKVLDDLYSTIRHNPAGNQNIAVANSKRHTAQVAAQRRAQGGGGGGAPPLPPLPPIDPARVAYINNTLGGSFAGGVIPRQTTGLPPNPWLTLKSMGFSVPQGVNLSRPTLTGEQVEGGSSPWGMWQSDPSRRSFSPWPGIMGQ